MPLYEYQCASCQKVHEVMQKFSDEPMKTCPECGGEVSKLISMSSFALKGSGWYSTDYKKSSAPPVASKSAANEPAGGSPGASASSTSSASSPSSSSPTAAPAAPTAGAPAKAGSSGSGDSK